MVVNEIAEAEAGASPDAIVFVPRRPTLSAF